MYVPGIKLMLSGVSITEPSHQPIIQVLNMTCLAPISNPMHFGAGFEAQFGRVLPSIHKCMSSVPQHCTKKSGMVVNTCNPSTQEVESGVSEVQGHLLVTANLRPAWAP